jgi:UPF0755 protein
MTPVKGISIFLLIGLIIFGFLWWFLGPVSSDKTVEVFIVPENTESFDATAELTKGKFIRNAGAFSLLKNYIAKDKPIASGGYRLTKSMNAWEVLRRVTGKPDLVWVTTHGCLRKEQIGEILAEKLGWNKAQEDEWDKLHTETDTEYIEGVYYPDTYLLPVDETPKQIAKRYIDRFNEKFAPLADTFTEKNIKWTTGLKIASLIAREAAGAEDMKLISGIIWNRLDEGIRLQIDATMQYTRGKKPDGSWWGGIDLAEKTSDSPYNTYLYKGLPPTPICSPSIDYVSAVVNPEETDCIFYLHDGNKQIHCAKTYAEHKRNIQSYLD